MKDMAVRQSFYNKKCLVCGRTPCDPCHIQSYNVSRKDDPDNIMHLCREHHGEQGDIGIVTFVKKYPVVKRYVERRGFYINAFNKLVRDIKPLEPVE